MSRCLVLLRAVPFHVANLTHPGRRRGASVAFRCLTAPGSYVAGALRARVQPSRTSVLHIRHAHNSSEQSSSDKSNAQSDSGFYTSASGVRVQAEDMVAWMRQVDERLQFHGHSMLRWGAAGVAVLLYVFHEDISKFLGRETSKVAKLSLQDEEVLRQTTQAGRHVVNNLLADPAMVAKASEFVVVVLQQPQTHAALVGSLQRLMSDEAVVAKATEFLTQALKAQQAHAQLLARETSTHVLTDEAVQMYGKQWVQAVLNDETVRKEAAAAVKGVLGNLLVPEFLTFGKAKPQLDTDSTNNDKKSPPP